MREQTRARVLLKADEGPEGPAWSDDRIAEALELSSGLARQALSRRIPDRGTMEQRTTAWQEERNAADATVDWQFTTEEARIKLKRLYPKIDD